MRVSELWGKERWNGRGGFRVGMSLGPVFRVGVALNSERRHISPGDTYVHRFSVLITRNTDRN